MRAGYRLLLILAGCCVLAIVLSPPLHELSERWFSVHMVDSWKGCTLAPV